MMMPAAFVINLLLIVALGCILVGAFIYLRGLELFSMTFHPNLCVNFEELDYPVQATPPEVREHRLQFITRALKVRTRGKVLASVLLVVLTLLMMMTMMMMMMLGMIPDHLFEMPG